MITYEDLPKNIRLIYTKEQCEELIKVAQVLARWCSDFIEAVQKISQSIQPEIDKIKELYEELEGLKEEKEVRQAFLNVKPKYPPYRPKVKHLHIYKKPIYYHIRSNCKRRQPWKDQRNYTPKMCKTLLT